MDVKEFSKLQSTYYDDEDEDKDDGYLHETSSMLNNLSILFQLILTDVFMS